MTQPSSKLATLLDDCVAANRVLAEHGVIDGYGHVSFRHPDNPQRYFIARSLAPELVTADDIMEFDLDSNPIDQRGRQMYSERYIHGEIYKTRPDVHACVHNHSPSVIPFGVTPVPMRPVYHMSAFIGGSVPVWDIRDVKKDSDMLVRDSYLGQALARCVGNCPAALMRGHGAVVVAANLPLVVGRSIYLEMNARLQMQAMQIAGGAPINFLDLGEAAAAEKVNDFMRAWNLWRTKALAQVAAEKRSA